MRLGDEFSRGVRAAISWLHMRAKLMNDPHAWQVLNSAGFSLGICLREGQMKHFRGQKPPPHPKGYSNPWSR